MNIPNRASSNHLVRSAAGSAALANKETRMKAAHMLAILMDQSYPYSLQSKYKNCKKLEYQNF
jgi:hypothetical protein